jgi:hypothetical protein
MSAGRIMSLDNYNFDGFIINLYVDEQGDWLAHFQEIPTISAFDDTPQDALVVSLELMFRHSNPSILGKI